MRGTIRVSISILILIAIFEFGFGSTLVYAEAEKPKVALLTSLGMRRVELPFYLFFRRDYFRHYEEKLGEGFKKVFEERGYQVLVSHEADQYHLWRALHSADLKAVFWVSHAGGPTVADPQNDTGVIVDEWGFDMKDVFREIDPHIQFLGIVGCHSQKTMEQILNNAASTHSRKLRWIAFDKTIDAKKGLKKAIQEGLVYLNPLQTEDALPSSAGYQIKIIRTLPFDSEVDLQTYSQSDSQRFYPAVRVENHGRVLGVFPKGIPGKKQRLYVSLPLKPSSLSPQEFKLVMNAGDNYSKNNEKYNLGKFEISSSWEGGHWKAFSDSDGIPIGVSSYVFQFDGLLPHEQEWSVQ